MTAVFLLPALAFAQSGVAARIQASYKELKDVNGSFTQRSFIKDLNRKETYGGDFSIKFPSRMRYTYKKGSGDEIVINKGVMIIYQKNEKQALRGKFDPGTYGAAPVSFLSGLGDLERDFTHAEENGRLLLKPRHPMGGVAMIEVEAAAPEDAFPIKSFLIRDTHSNTVEIILSGVNVNSGIKDSVFEFAPPEGVSIYEIAP